MAPLPPASSQSFSSADTLISVQDIYKSYGDKKVLQGISVEVHENEVLAVIGTSGCGKSTLLRLVAGLEAPDQGTVTLEDPNFTLVFQYSALFDSLTVLENVAFSLLEDPDDAPHASSGHPPRQRPKLSMAEIRDQVGEKLRMVGLEGIEDKYPNQLSGGMQKRVSFARAIMSNPKIILYDEPTAGLDPVASKSLEDYILKLRDELGAASIVVTHTMSTIFRTANRVCLLHNGKIHWLGPPQELLRTDDPIVHEFASAGVIPELTGYPG